MAERSSESRAATIARAKVDWQHLVQHLGTQQRVQTVGAMHACTAAEFAEQTVVAHSLRCTDCGIWGRRSSVILHSQYTPTTRRTALLALSDTGVKAASNSYCKVWWCSTMPAKLAELGIVTGT